MKEGTVLIVDDEPTVRDVLCDILETAGYGVVAVDSGMTALKEAQQKNFDVLVADIRMPGMGGLALIQKFRKLNPQIVPIVITGYPSPETKAVANKFGIHDYIVKPIGKVELCNIIANALRRKKVAGKVAEDRRGRILKTRVFDLRTKKYKNLSELAQAMEISVSQVYRVLEGKRNINQKFIIGAIKAFPEYEIDDLFYVAPD